MLSNEGINVITAESGNKGIEILKNKNDIDLILLDVHMPSLDGIETLKIIKENHKDKYSILMFSSVDLGDKMPKIKEYGANDYLIKPATKKEVLEKIKQVIKSNTLRKKKKYIQDISKPDNNYEKVLIVEDNEINMKVIMTMIKRIGNYEISLAEDGLKAIENFERLRPDIIFMDIQIPNISGYEAFERIKDICKMKNWKMPKVIAMTAYAMDEDREKILKAGFDIYLPKPIKTEQVKGILLKK